MNDQKFNTQHESQHEENRRRIWLTWRLMDVNKYTNNPVITCLLFQKMTKWSFKRVLKLMLAILWLALILGVSNWCCFLDTVDLLEKVSISYSQSQIKLVLSLTTTEMILSNGWAQRCSVFVDPSYEYQRAELVLSLL